MSDKKLSFKQAAADILKRFKKAMTAAEITKIAIDEDLLDSSGNTPEATMAAQLYVDINKNKNTPFMKAGRGLFALKTGTDVPSSPKSIIESQNEITQKRLKELLHTMDPIQFEYLAAELLEKIGYEDVNVTKRAGDNGIDIIANLTVGGVTNVKTVIQVKRYAPLNKITGAVINQLRGSAQVDQRGLVITTSDFTKDGIEQAHAPNRMPVSLVNGDKLIQLLMKYEVGVKKQELFVYSINEEYFQISPTEKAEQLDSGKNRAIWPLPGGINNYVETLNRFLAEIVNGNNTKKGLAQWYLKSFENVNGKRAIDGYLNVPRSIGLTSYNKEAFSLTEKGKEYFNAKSKQLLYEIISNNILAFDDIYEFLKTSEVPMKHEDILSYLKDNFDIEWTSFAQVNFRLCWLISLDKVVRAEGGFKAV